MTLFIPVRKWYKKKQPKGPQTVNWALPISNGLEFAIVSPTTTHPEIAYGRTVNTVTGTILSADTEYGEGLWLANETPKSVSYNVPHLSPPFTCIIGYKVLEIPTSTRQIVGTYVSDTSGFRIYANTTEFGAQFGRTGAAQALHGSAIAKGNKIDAVVADSTDFFYYENGVLSASAAQAGFVEPTTLFTLGGSSPPKSTIAFCYYWSRALSADEIRDITNAPYSLLLPSTEILALTESQHDASGDLVGPGAELSGVLTRDTPGSVVGGDLVGPGAIMAGVIHHAAVLNHDLTGDLIGASPVMTGQMKVGIIHDLTGDIVAGSPVITGRLNNDTQGPAQQVIYIVGGDGEPVRKRKRITRANEDLDKLFDDVIRELFGLDDVEALENAIESLPITFDVDLEAMTRIEEIKTLIAAYEQYLDDEAAAQILLMG